MLLNFNFNNAPATKATSLALMFSLVEKFHQLFNWDTIVASGSILTWTVKLEELSSVVHKLVPLAVFKTLPTPI